MSLLDSIQAIKQRPLTAEEVSHINNFSRMHDIDESDPLVVIMAYLASAQMTYDQMPAQMEKSVRETIELHRTTLREQSMLIAKDLVGNIAQTLEQQSKYKKALIINYLGFFIGGAFFTILLQIVLQHFLKH